MQVLVLFAVRFGAMRVVGSELTPWADWDPEHPGDQALRCSCGGVHFSSTAPSHPCIPPCAQVLKTSPPLVFKPVIFYVCGGVSVGVGVGETLHVDTFQGIHVEVTGQLVGVNSFLPRCEPRN